MAKWGGGQRGAPLPITLPPRWHRPHVPSEGLRGAEGGSDTFTPCCSPAPPTPQFPYHRCDLLDGTRSACDFAPVGRMRGGGGPGCRGRSGGRAVGRDGKSPSCHLPAPSAGPSSAGIRPGVPTPSFAPRFAISGWSAGDLCAPPSRLSSPERQRCVSSGLGAALRCRRGGGFARRWTPPPRKAAPGGAGTAARRSCGAQGCGVRRTRVRLSVLPPRASRRASAPGFSMAPRPRPPPPPTKRSALTSPNPPPPPRC